MPWNNQNGGNGPSGGRGPWGAPPGGSGGNGPQPPDLEEILRKAQEKLKRFIPGGIGGGRLGSSGVLIVGLVIVIAWLASGIYFVQANEQGVVLRFGKFIDRTGAGMHYHLPWPIETVLTPNVTRPLQVNIGYSGGDRDISEESLMLTGDENIVDINFTVLWVVKDASAFLFNVQNPNGPEATVKAVAESAMREVVGENQIEGVLTENREAIQKKVENLMQQMLDTYGAGIEITNVQMQKADPPQQVLDAYRDVQAARTDQDRMRNEAEAYANKVIPEARGAAAQIKNEAEAYEQQITAEATGEAQRFLSVYEQYKKAPNVTKKRIYLETMQEILSGVKKVIVDGKGGTGVVPYMALPNLQNNSGANQ